MIIPSQLKKNEFRFIKLNGKIPYEKEWQSKNNYSYEDLELQNYNGNYGIITGIAGLVVIDFDNKELQDKIIPKLSKTFTTQSGSGLLHKWFFVDSPQTVKILDKNKNTLADIQGKNKQIVCPPSVHPTTKKEYFVVDDSQIAKTTMAEIKALFSNHIHDKEKKYNDTHKQDDITAKIKSKITIPNLLSKYGISTDKNPTECFLHSSKGGKCLSYTNELWNCFHCDKGGDIFNLVMLKENIDFKAAKRLLAKEIGIEIKNENPTIIDLLPYSELRNMKDKRDYLIEKILPEKSVCMFNGQPESAKSLLEQDMALSISNGIKFLDKKTKKSAVLICDMENGLIEIRDRLNKLANGLNIKTFDFPLYITESSISLDNPAYRNALFKIIEEKNIKLVIFDTLNRFGSWDENSSSDINRIYTTIFKPIKQMGATVLFLHHCKKGSNEYRGSGDFLGNVDKSYSIAKKNNNFILKNTKNRFAAREKEIFGELEFKDDSIYIGLAEHEKEKEDKKKRAKELIIDILNEKPSTNSEIIRIFNEKYPDLDISERTIRRSTNELFESETIRKKGTLYIFEN